MIDWAEYPIGDFRAMCPSCGRAPKDKTMGITIAHDEHGVAHCFRCGYIETRRGERKQTEADRKAFARRMDALRRQHDAEQRRQHADVAAAAAIRWAAASPCTEHPYLIAKDVRPYGVKVDAANALLVPVRDAEGRLHSLQSIGANSSKLFMPGGRIKGCYHSIGKPSGRVIVCEGYATGATLHAAAGDGVAVAFNANNLQAVAMTLRMKYPCLSIILAADDDWKTDGNPGLTAAQQAALAVGGKVAVPDFTGYQRGDKDTDFNDLQRLAGAVAIGGGE